MGSGAGGRRGLGRPASEKSLALVGGRRGSDDAGSHGVGAGSGGLGVGSGLGLGGLDGGMVSPRGSFGANRRLHAQRKEAMLKDAHAQLGAAAAGGSASSSLASMASLRYAKEPYINVKETCSRETYQETYSRVCGAQHGVGRCTRGVGLVVSRDRPWRRVGGGRESARDVWGRVRRWGRDRAWAAGGWE